MKQTFVLILLQFLTSKRHLLTAEAIPTFPKNEEIKFTKIYK